MRVYLKVPYLLQINLAMKVQKVIRSKMEMKKTLSILINLQSNLLKGSVLKKMFQIN
jgi:hypothetical protein